MFSGIFTALITPFKRGKVDYDGFSKLFNWQIDEGINGIVICGSTGEAQSLSDDEYKELVKLSINTNQDRVPLVVGIPFNTTWKIVETIKTINSDKISAFLISAPYYVRPTQEGIYKHFDLICKKTGAPVIVYNVPHRCGIEIKNETMLKIMGLENVVAVKEASDNIESPIMLTTSNDRISILSGNDTTYAAFRVNGGHGCISVASNILPGPFLDLENAIKCGDLAKTMKLNKLLFPIAKSLFYESNPIPIKYAVSLIKKYILPEPRLPLTSISNKGKQLLQKQLYEFNQLYTKNQRPPALH